ncbi:MAG: hypothetical protein J0H46_18825 [Bacteroidetes bacterium]|mgnify:CR=1 FL=1|nr:hypothetical protein [Bacteroidota bacterium]
MTPNVAHIFFRESNWFVRIKLAILLIFSAGISYAGRVDYATSDQLVTIPGTSMSVLEDATNTLSYQQAFSSTAYKPVTSKIPNFALSNSAFWIKFELKNNTSETPLLLVEQPLIDEGDIYVFSQDGKLLLKESVDKHKPFYERKYNDRNYVFSTGAQPGNTVEILLRVKSAAQLVFPVRLGTETQVVSNSYQKELLMAIFTGIILVMSFYNLFVYFSVRDRSYLLYVVYIITVGLTQTTLQSFTFKYLWPNSPWLALQGPTLFSCLGAMAAIEFIKNFLRTKEQVRKLHYGLIFFNGIFVFSIALSLLGMRSIAFQVMQLNTAIASLYSLFVSYVIYRRHYRPAGFFLLAWSLLLIGAVIFVLKDYDIVPYNTASTFALQIASVIEIVLLSFALADKINIFRKEKEESQAQAMGALEENARIVREQNIILEAKVTERTQELRQSNDDLSKAISDLKEAEMQLVESEKMASLGQLTAGIAHEINNPINFVTSNVKPLKRDVDMVITMLNEIETITLNDEPVEEKKKKIDDLKQEYDFDYLKTEIDYLLNGINEGSSRTAEIVKGLRIFSRLDEDDLKKANINEGLDSTLVIVNNQLDNRIEVAKHYGDLPLVECFPGKLNQVFLNIMTNGLYAIKERFKEAKGGLLTVSTSANGDSVTVRIKDNGTGMDEATKKKLFEPFFTTKDVGEGTGLGLSIAYNTIAKHNGTINVNSALGEGTEFIIELPIIHQTL